ncbi:hypothetical protein FOZ63_032227, partial [Perkinsus olseni]
KPCDEVPPGLHAGQGGVSAHPGVTLTGVADRTTPEYRSIWIDRLSSSTEGYSGSDIKQLMCAAAMIPIRETLSKLASSTEGDVDPPERRSIEYREFILFTL